MEKNQLNNHTVAIIGSFKQHYDEILRAIKILKSVNIKVTTPLGSEVLRPNIPFVRFSSDNPDFFDEMVQTETLKKIFLAKAVYVIAPKGYVGRTTCYEIGRIIQKRKPIYFSEHPIDLPIKVPKSHIVSIKDFAKKIFDNHLTWPFDASHSDLSLAERKLLEI